MLKPNNLSLKISGYVQSVLAVGYVSHNILQCVFFFFSFLFSVKGNASFGTFMSLKVLFFVFIFRIGVVYPFSKEMLVTYPVILGSLAVS